MIVVEKVAELRELLDLMPDGRTSVGFVPTMGALHAGHTSLINKAKIENQVVVSSIFVNPAQFNDKNDLANYSRTPETDTQLLSEAGCDVLFFPSVAEMYPDDTLLDMDFGLLERVMEGHYRPGHFKGVATVVFRFFNIIRPHRAYFGEKDFQQLAIIREMNRRLHTGIAIVGCETLRDPDGLAMSSRNIHLTAEERREAGIIYATLIWVAQNIRNRDLETLHEEAVQKIESVAGFRVQYLEFVAADTLQKLEKYMPGQPQRACVAVLTSRTRLIDNIAL